MQIKCKATVFSVTPDSFTDKVGKLVEYTKIVALVDGEIVEVNSKDVDVINYATEHLKEEQNYILSFLKTPNGPFYKARLSI